MPTSQTPLLLLDNLFDTIVQYPLATLSTTSEASGREAVRVADYRRERSWWQPAAAAANHNVTVDLGAGATANVDFLWLDRRHNLDGLAILVQYSDNGSAWTTHQSLTVPALDGSGNYVVGGDPTSGFCVTEEGACYALFAAAAAAHRYWRFVVVPNVTPQVPGIMLGSRSQLAGYSSISDDDEGGRKGRSEESDAGYVATGRVYAWRTAQLSLTLIGDTEYDGKLRQIRRLMFEQGQPALLCLNYGFYASRMWLFQCADSKWSAPKKTVYRDWRMTLREVGAVVF